MCCNSSRMKNWSFDFRPTWCMLMVMEVMSKGLWVNQDRKFIITAKRKHSIIFIHFRPVLLKEPSYFTFMWRAFCVVVLPFDSCVYVCVLSHVHLFEAPWTVAHQTSLSMEFSREEYWSGFPFSPPADLPEPGIEPASLVFSVLVGGFFTASGEIYDSCTMRLMLKGSLPPFLLSSEKRAKMTAW